MTTKIDLDDLERKARAATTGPWSWDDKDGYIVDPGGLVAFGEPTHEGNHRIEISDENATHIAANSPPVTLALIARIRELEGALREACDGWRDHVLSDHYGNPISQLTKSDLARPRAVLEKGTVLP